MEKLKIEEWVSKACQELGCRLYFLEQNSKTLQVYIYRPEENITLSDCEKVLKRIKLFLSAEGFDKSMQLEVSSPGLDRKLIHPWHFSSALGQMISFKTRGQSPKKISGALSQVNSKGFTLQSISPKNSHKDKAVYFDFDSVHQVRVVFQAPKEQKYKVV